jgi:two-component system, chemotaxis family, protein-glutamate methylesterase/glutaminase
MATANDMIGSPPAKPRILVVDDSAVVRQSFTAILSAAGMEVEVAPDPIFAMARLKRERPDAVILDIEMPRMDGLTFLRWLMAQESPIPTLICSARAGPGTRAAVQALERGAVGIVSKPPRGLKGFLRESAEQIVEAVQGAVRARVRRRMATPEPVRDAGTVLPPRPAPLVATGHQIVVVGASTGGTEAITALLQRMPPDAPGFALVQHMPEGFTAPFAARLNELCQIEVEEARSGDSILPGRALIAPGNRHLTVKRTGDRYAAEVQDGPRVSRHRPSVDVLFRSAAQAAGPDAVGVILTGMGDDGSRGLLELRQAGAHTIAQDEASCVVFGMPREAIAAGAACEVVPLGEIGAAVLRRTAPGRWRP